MAFNIKQSLTRLGSNIKLSAKANYPKWMVIGGTLILVGASIGACIKTYKELPKVLDAHKEMLSKVKDLKKAHDEGAEIKLPDNEKYTKESYQRHVFCTYMSTGGKIVKIYALPFALALLGVVLIFKGHSTTQKRYLAAAAEGYAISEAFKNYRGRVVDRYGQAVEEELFMNGERKLVTTEETDPITGEKRQVTKDTLCADRSTALDDPWCFIFDEANCPHSWSRHPGYNYRHLIDMQNAANDYLKAHGSITLAELMRQIGFKDDDIPVDAMRYGWMIDNPLCTDPKKQVVDFGICAMNGVYEDVGCFLGGTPDYLLHFNVQGDIQAAMLIKRKRDKERKDKAEGRRQAMVAAVLKSA